MPRPAPRAPRSSFTARPQLASACQPELALPPNQQRSFSSNAQARRGARRWRSVFAWHTEDVDLFSLNLLHFGAPKFWYSVGPEHAGRLEQLAAAAFPDVLKETRCRRFLRHKTTMLSPEQLKRAGIPFVRAIQRPGDIMLTYAGAYHAGFNTGFNCAESANFVAPLWWPQGEKAVHSMCICRPDHVRINLAALRQAVEAFMQRGGEERWSRAGTACQAAASAAGASGDCESAAAAGAASFGGARGSSSAAASDEGGPKPWDAGSAMAIAPGKARQLSLPELPPSTLDLGSADNFGGFVRFRDEVIEAGLWGWGLGDGDGAAEAALPMTGSLGRSQIRVAKCLPGTGDGGTEASQPGSASSDVLPLKQLLSKLEPWRARLLRETLAHCNADGAGTGSRGGRTAKAPAPGPPAVWVKWTDGSMFSGRAIDYGSGSVRVHYPGYDRGEDEWHCIDGEAIAARAEPSNYCWRRPAGWMAAESFMEVTVAKGMGPPGDLGAERDRAAQEAASLWAAQPGPRLGAEAFADRPPNWRNMLWRVRVRPPAAVSPETSWTILETEAAPAATAVATKPATGASPAAAADCRQPKRPRSPVGIAASAPAARVEDSKPEVSLGSPTPSESTGPALPAAQSWAKRPCPLTDCQSTPSGSAAFATAAAGAAGTDDAGHADAAAAADQGVPALEVPPHILPDLLDSFPCDGV